MPLRSNARLESAKVTDVAFAYGAKAVFAEILNKFMTLSEDDRGRLLAAVIVSCVATAALLYSLPRRGGMRATARPASFFLLGEIISGTRLWGIGLLSSLPIWLLLFAVALAVPAAFDEAKRLSRVEFGATLTKAFGSELSSSVEKIINSVPPILDPSVTAIVVVALLLPHVFEVFAYYRNLVCNVFAIEDAVSSHALEMADVFLAADCNHDHPGDHSRFPYQEKLADHLNHPCPIPPELAEIGSRRHILAYQILYCVRKEVRSLGARRAIEQFAKKMEVSSDSLPNVLPRLDFRNVLVSLVIFAVFSALYVLLVPTFLYFLPNGKGLWPEPTFEGRLGLTTSIVQNSFTILIPFVVGLYRYQSLVPGLRNRVSNSKDIRFEQRRLFCSTAAWQMVLSIVMGISVSSIRYVLRDVFDNSRQIDLHPFAIGNVAYLIIAAFVPGLLLYVWTKIPSQSLGYRKSFAGYSSFVAACGFIFLTTQLALELILRKEGDLLQQSFWHHFLLGASLGFFLVLAISISASLATDERKLRRAEARG